MPDPNSGRGRKPPRPPTANTYWRGPPGGWTLWARVELKGKPIRWSLRLVWPLRAGDVETAHSRIEARRTQLISAAHYGDARRTYADVFVEWGEKHIVHAVGPNTARRYAASLRMLEPYLLDCFLDEIDKKKIMAIVDGRRGAGVVTATIRRDLTALASVLDYAIDRDWLETDHNVALERLKRLQEKRDPIVLPDAADVARVVAAAPAMQAALIRAALATGCRITELVTAQRNRLDHTRRELTVVGKGNRLRTVDLEPYGGYDILKSLPARLNCKWLFWHDDGRPYTSASGNFSQLVSWVAVRARREAAARAKAAGVVPGDADFRGFRFHDLRHLHAVTWLRDGRSIYDLQQRLGHTSVQTTEIYLKYLPREQQLGAKRGSAESQTESQAKRFLDRSGA